MKKLQYAGIDYKNFGFLIAFAILSVVIAIALGAAYYMEHHGHHVTGMSNQVVWGTPHVFAIFLILSASGVLNIASIGTVFQKHSYQPLGRLSGLLAISLLIGGLAILVLDLGRPDRLIVAMTTYNFTSIFAWNILLYNGFIVVVGIYLWFMMDPLMKKYYPHAGMAAFIWRLILTTGTGAIFGFLVARQAYDAAIMAPMFIAMSFSFGLAIFLLFLMAIYSWTKRELGDFLLSKLKNLLGVFVAAAFYFVAVYHVTNLYITQHQSYEYFILANGGIYTLLFWVGYIIIGTLLPIFLIYCKKMAKYRSIIILSSLLVIVGAFSLLYVIIIGGQVVPLEIFPGKEVVESGFFDGIIANYAPSLWEVLLGIGGMAIGLLVAALGLVILPFLPVSLADKEISSL